MSDTIITIEPKQPLVGDYAWVIMALGIFAYDMFAIKTRKFETMSSAIYRSLDHPIKGPTAILAWLTVTHHLFGTKRARQSYIARISSRKLPK